jgi:hypothetical protein
VVRCPSCGEAVSEWAARCPRCRAGLEDATPIPRAHAPEEAGPPAPVELPTPAPVDPPDVRSPRISRRKLAVGLVGVACAGVAIGALWPTGSSSGPLVPAASSSAAALNAYTLIYAGLDGLRVVPLNGRRPSQPVTAPAESPLGTTEGVVFVQSGWAYLLAPPFTTARALAPADRLFPMTWPGEVGVSRNLDRDAESVDFVDLDGSPNADLRVGVLSGGYEPVAQFLAEGPGGTLRSWVPGSDGHLQLTDTLGQPAATVVGGDGNDVAWTAATGCTASGECPLHLTMPSGPDRTVPPPAGHGGFLPGGALAPDGQTLATFVSASVPGRDQAELVLVDTTTMAVTVVPDSSFAIEDGVPLAQWTPDSEFVFFSGGTGRMHFYRPGDLAAGTLNCSGSTSFAVGQGGDAGPTAGGPTPR